MPPSDFGTFKTFEKTYSKVALFKPQRSFFALRRTDLSLVSTLAVHVLAALSLGTNEFLNTRDVCVRACGFRPTTASIACSHWACLSNALANFLHHTELSVVLSLRSHYCLCSVALFTQCLNPHIIGWQHFTHIGTILKVILKISYRN